MIRISGFIMTLYLSRTVSHASVHAVNWEVGEEVQSKHENDGENDERNRKAANGDPHLASAQHRWGHALQDSRAVSRRPKAMSPHITRITTTEQNRHEPREMSDTIGCRARILPSVVCTVSAAYVSHVIEDTCLSRTLAADLKRGLMDVVCSVCLSVLCLHLAA
jgi:hypothetical protein